MNRVLLIALREFVATVATKAFIIGLLFLPIMITLSVVVVGLVNRNNSFQLKGEVAIIDPTGRIAPRMQEEFDRHAQAALPAEVVQATGIPEGVAKQVQAAIAPQLTVQIRPPNTNLDEEKKWLLAKNAKPDRLGVIVVDSDAIEPASRGADLGAYELYVPAGLDERALSAINTSLRSAIRGERLASQGFDRALIERLTDVPQVQSVTVTEGSGAEGVSERTTVPGFNMMLPFAFMFLLFMGVMGGGQGLLTTTITEKSSRVVEVLLSAVSPMQLMAGKLIGHMSVSLLGMSIYLVAGLFALSSFSMIGLLDPMLIVYLFIFFIITFFVIGSFMLSIGAAVNELSESQSLMMPVTIMIILPMALWFPISRDPSSTLATVVSFVPPINTFGMVLRMASTEPPPAWQIWLSVGIGIVTVYGVLWFASKVFRIGLLLHGKPPDLKTLVRWVRAA